MNDAAVAPPAAEPFASCTALQSAHFEFRGGPGGDTRPAPHTADAIRAFVARARETGRLLRDASERRTAQSILDFWSAELVSSPGATAADYLPAVLEPYEGDAQAAVLDKPAEAGAATTPEPAGASALDEAPAQPSGRIGKSGDDRSREIIRLSASARLWRDSGRQFGYLIWGKDEIARAAEYRSFDPAIDELVTASEQAIQKLNRRRFTAGSVGMVVLLVLLAIVTWLWILADQRAATISTQNDELNARNELLAKEASELNDSLDATRAALTRSREIAEAADGLERRLDSATLVLRRLYQSGKITARDVPSDIAAGIVDPAPPASAPPPAAADAAPPTSDQPGAAVGEVEPRRAPSAPPRAAARPQSTIALPAPPASAAAKPAPAAAPPAPSAAQAPVPYSARPAPSAAQAPGKQSPPRIVEAGGYDANFLRLPLPLPGLGPERVRLDYVNHSVVLDRRRRMAVVAASNFDRNRRIVVPRQPPNFVPDPRLAAKVQPDPAWFAGPEIDHGHLAARQEISWASALPAKDEDWAKDLAASVNFLPNITPQLDSFNRSVWSGLEQWVLADHNRDATRLTIFTGPVFGDDDPVIDGARVPRRFFKIAVSQRASGPGGLIVDAFMISQFREGTERKIAPAEFTPDAFRVGVDEIERITGLDFGDAVRYAPGSDSAASEASVAPRPDDTVYFQFAGMTRQDALYVSRRLQALGWKIHGEERTGTAAGLNEVRYNDRDRAAGEMLVFDLKGLGLTVKGVPSARVVPGYLEMWLSK